MSIFDGNRELTGEVFRQYKFSEFASKDGWFNTILNRNLPLVIYLHIVEDNDRYSVTGYSNMAFGTLKLKEKYIENTIDLAILIRDIKEINFSTFLDYFEYYVI